MKDYRPTFALVAITLAFALLFFGVSCTPDAEGDLIQVSLAKTNPKALGSSLNSEVVSYEYKATTLFSNSNTVGETDWTAIDILEDEASLGFFSQGTWTFELRGRNSNDTIVVYGTTTVKLSQVEARTINIALGLIDGNGTLEVSVALDIEAYEEASVSLWYKPYVNKTFGERVDVPLSYDEESGLYTKTVTGLEDGNYLVGIVYEGGEDDDAGEVMVIRILNGITTRIFGVIENGILYGEDLTIATVRTLRGSLGEKEVSLPKDGTATFQWENKGKVPAQNYTWFLDDTLLEGATASSLSYTQSDNRNHVVTCVAYGRDGEMASASRKIVFAARTWQFEETEQKLDGFTYEFDGEKLSVYYYESLVNTITEGKSALHMSTHANITFTKSGDVVTILNNGTDAIGYYRLK